MKERELLFRSVFFSFFSKILLLVSGFLYTFFIANYFSPEEYGLVNFYLGFIGSIVLLFGSEAISETVVVFIAKTNSRKLLNNLFKLQLIISFLLFLVLFFSANFFVLFFNKGTINFVLIASFTALFIPFSFFIPAIFRGFKSFGKVLELSIIESFGNLFFAFIFVFFFKLGLSGIIYAKIISIVVLSIFSIFLLRTLPFSFSLEEKQKNEAIKYSKNSFLFNFFKKAYDQIILFLLGLFVSPLLVGFYYLLDKLSSYFIQIPVLSLSEALLPFSSANEKNLSFFISTALRVSLVVALILAIFFVFVSSIILQIFFPSFVNASSFIVFFALFYFLTFFNVLPVYFKAINRVDFLVKGFILVDLISLIVGVPLVRFFSLYGLILLKILAECVFFFFLFLNLKKTGLKLDLRLRKSDFLLLLNFFKSLFSFQLAKK